ncbi:MAG TPA: hypothetical protein V6D09_04100 [Leptolyngbyaceae cyanobacterium]
MYNYPPKLADFVIALDRTALLMRYQQRHVHRRSQFDYCKVGIAHPTVYGVAAIEV